MASRRHASCFGLVSLSNAGFDVWLGCSEQVVTLDLCTVLLMDDSRYNWLVLVPRRVSHLRIPCMAAQQAM
jgi:hypothetical protein